jgi:hypothetical protein
MLITALIGVSRKLNFGGEGKQQLEIFEKGRALI